MQMISYLLGYGENYSILCNCIGLDQYTVYDSSRELNLAVFSQLSDSRFGADLESSIFWSLWWREVSLHTRQPLTVPSDSFVTVQIPFFFPVLLFCKYAKK